jgi:hypothetical protein
LVRVVPAEAPAGGEAHEAVGLPIAIGVLHLGHVRHLRDADLGGRHDVDAAAIVEAGGEELPLEIAGITGWLRLDDVAAAKYDKQRIIGSKVHPAHLRRSPFRELDVLDLVAIVEVNGRSDRGRKQKGGKAFDREWTRIHANGGRSEGFHSGLERDWM